MGLFAGSGPVDAPVSFKKAGPGDESHESLAEDDEGMSKDKLDRRVHGGW